MTYPKAIWTPISVLLPLLVAACSSCSDGGTKTDAELSTDAGKDTSTASDADADSDTDTDADSGKDSGADSGTDGGLGPDGCLVDRGVLVWDPIPEGMECGPGCRQISTAKIFLKTGYAVNGGFVAATSNEDFGDALLVSRLISPDRISGNYTSFIFC